MSEDNLRLLSTIEAATHYLLKGGMHPDQVIEVTREIFDYKRLDWTEDQLHDDVYGAYEAIYTGGLSGKRSIQREIEDLVATVAGNQVSLQSCYNSLQLKTKEEMSAARMALTRLCKKGVIEPIQNKIGLYRKVDNKVEGIDFINASGEALDLKWPFNIERMCMVLPKNIIVVTGSPDTGKTAFLLDFIRRNMDRFRINYFSSEMGALELKGRLEKFPQLTLDKWKFNPVERSSNFADVIQPNDINVIDFLEIHQDFYLIGQWIKDIFDKLDKGIAVIAIQKNTGKGVDIARGGVGSLEKPRLYLSLSNNPHTLKIVKAKNWVNEMINPNGLFIRYKIVGGCQFKKEKTANGQEADWEKEHIEGE